MSKSAVKYISLATLGLLAASIAPQIASAATTQVYNSQGEVTFTPGTDTTGPVDPQDPTTPVTPTEPDGVNPGGPTMPDSGLTIVYASSFDFGSHPVSNKAEVYNAAAQKLDDGTTRTNYVQVADNRGTFSGWNLKVQMTDFTTSDAGLVANGHGTLTGATITLGDAEIQGAGTANPADISAASTVLTPGVQSGTILGATAGHGSGNSLLDFGGKDGATKDTAVTLAVPAGVAGAAQYTADLTWTLDDTPAN
ncbi:WxL domain-containing protein [Lactococcus allomyrinae]|uniref:WxL domain-containing protein n=1 Tax=Lactococcus allomyrinae TaxID=2419773 RepID=A0A387BIB5_9LACT|nr:WxL domain-containing protein [Lactococcus allomyrinae]AYG00364.1 WxL domain-containing protein [Lactococcus allomyrinae]AYG00856.1 WxL domain-containing protein [Lactococcus allomyrinae]